MTLAATRARTSPEETRARIIEVAEEHFRRVGYAKTAVADIAAELGMSPANIYRFFPSKSAINEAICARLLGEAQAHIAAIAGKPVPAAERLAELIISLHRLNKARLTAERRMHEMVAVAMAENWASIEVHCDCVKSTYARVIRDGVESGEFGAVDPDETGAAVFKACICLFHPMLIAQGADKDLEAEAAGLIALILRALRP
jgi:AcrR family transcriptional regulator